VRLAAARVVGAVAGAGASLSRVLPEATGRVRDRRDRALLQALAYGSLRLYPRLSWLLDRMLAKPLKRDAHELRALLCIGLYQIEETRIPAHAAVAETVDAAKKLTRGAASGLANAVLRRYLREQEDLRAAMQRVPVARWAHPEWLLDAFRRDWPDGWEAVLDAGNQQAPMWVRVNLAKISRSAYAERLHADAGLEASPCPHSAAALRLPRPLDALELPGFGDGLVSVQDAAAQLAAPLLDPQPGQRVLDACAAPGGKGAHVLEFCPDARLTCLDIDRERLDRVGETMARLDLEAALVCADAAQPAVWWDGVPFDRILLDAPCSATGVIRRHPDIKLLRRPSDVAATVELQSSLLEAMWSVLAPGGRMVYATCSVLEAENAAQIGAFAERHTDAQVAAPPASWGRVSGQGRQVLSGEDGMDGFYYACVTKSG